VLRKNSVGRGSYVPERNEFPKGKSPQESYRQRGSQTGKQIGSENNRTDKRAINKRVGQWGCSPQGHLGIGLMRNLGRGFPKELAEKYKKEASLMAGMESPLASGWSSCGQSAPKELRKSRNTGVQKYGRQQISPCTTKSKGRGE